MWWPSIRKAAGRRRSLLPKQCPPRLAFPTKTSLFVEQGTSVTESKQMDRRMEQSGRNGPGPTLHTSRCCDGLSPCPQEPFRAEASQSCQGNLSEDLNDGPAPFLSNSRTRCPTRSSTFSRLRSHQKRQHRNRLQRKSASGRSLPRERQEGTSSPATNSELPRNSPSTSSMKDLCRSLMESLDTTQICLSLLAKMEKNNGSSAQRAHEGYRSKYPVCMQCCRCLDNSCPHHSSSSDTTATAMLTALIFSLDVVVQEEKVKLKVGLLFNLSVSGKTLHAWGKNVWLPKRCGSEEYCEECGDPLPRSPQNWGMQQGESLPTTAPVWPLPPWAQPIPPDALERLQRAGMEPMPQVEYRGLGHSSTVQCLLCFWWRMKSKVKNLKKVGTAEGNREISI
ncbi:uncharacterized protein LOC104910020 isoform X2 [Meleagris gallopavo]|uniref:uncharacterized protein LOC104910020 isoform X2 n=1 Tax=Meleagris gallopavo TaxID=9103 RepID=UPI000938C2C4|nr:uncharacterized protein LOC104910020 isoform X2 [Meleagris gallopavo]